MLARASSPLFSCPSFQRRRRNKAPNAIAHHATSLHHCGNEPDSGRDHGRGNVMTTQRRTILKGMLATSAAMSMPAILRAQSAPFKIGLLTVKTGPLAQGGIQMEQGIATFLKENNNTLAGRKVELLVGDTGGNPAGAKTKAQ